MKIIINEFIEICYNIINPNSKLSRVLNNVSHVPTEILN